MGLAFEDKTGQPYALKDFEEALKVVEGLLLHPPLDRPLLVVHLPIIRDGLRLLIAAGKRSEEPLGMRHDPPPRLESAPHD